MMSGGKFADGLRLGVDGGGTRCRARLISASGEVLGEGEAGPANLRLGLIETFAAVLDAGAQCLAAAGLRDSAFARTTACLALAGASEPTEQAAARRYKLPFRDAIITSDAEAACIGAHGGGDGAIIILGTGSIGWSIVAGRSQRVGGWGLAVSDEGSGAWLGAETIRRVLWAHDERIDWTPLLTEVFASFERDPHAIVRWTVTAKPGDYGRFAPRVIRHAQHGDPVAAGLLRRAALHVDALVERVLGHGVARVSLVGGLAPVIEPFLSTKSRHCLVPPMEDALSGALRIASGAAPSRTAAE